MHVIYDEETYPNYFLCGVKVMDGPIIQYEISDRRNDIAPLMADIHKMTRMIGFNNLGFDYPVLHHVLCTARYQPVTADTAYQKVLQIFSNQDRNARWEHEVPYREWMAPQVDLFRIYHFDNAAKSTSLKALQFNMRSMSVEDLPIAPGTWLTPEQMDIIAGYNRHDLTETEKFAKIAKRQIDFREELGPEYMNANETAIGKKYFIKALERRQPGLTRLSNGAPRQTPRPQIRIADAMMPHVRDYRYHDDRLNKARDEIYRIVLEGDKTKDVIFENTDIGGFVFEFGTGGLHGSVRDKIVKPGPGQTLLDMDVTGYYSSIAISWKIAPEHLGEAFHIEYANLKAERQKHAKGTIKNAALKLSLNGVYGDSNNKYGPFYDPRYMITVTINGQFMVVMLPDLFLAHVPGVQIIQVNTDGLTILFDNAHRSIVDDICRWWQAFTRLDLEFKEYAGMWVKHCNSYIALDKKGNVKRIKEYQYDYTNAVGEGWHQDQSQLVVPKAAEAYLLHGTPLNDFIRSHQDPFDFMIRAKIQRNCRFEGMDPNIKNLRYYVSLGGHELVKIMPPLAGKVGERHMKMKKGRKVTECNRLTPGWQMTNIDYDYYIQEARKLTKAFT